MDLPQDVRERLELILQKNPEELLPYEVAFLNGRRFALNNEQKRVFASVLISDEPTEGEKNEVAPVTPQAPADLPPVSTQYTDPVTQEPVAPVEEAAPVVQTLEAVPAEQVPPVTPVVPEAVAETPPVEPVAPQQDQALQPSQPAAEVPSVPEAVPVDPTVNPYDVNPDTFDPAA